MSEFQGIVRFVAGGNNGVTSFIRPGSFLLDGHPDLHSGFRGSMGILIATSFTSDYDPQFELWDQDPHDTPEIILERAKKAVAKASIVVAHSIIYPRVPPEWKVVPDVLSVRADRMVTGLSMEREKAQWLVESVAKLREWQRCQKFAESLLEPDSKKCLELAANNPEVTVNILSLDPALISADFDPNEDVAKTIFIVSVGKALLGEETDFGGNWDELRNLEGTLEIRELLAGTIRERSKLARAHCIVNGWHSAVRAEDVVAIVPEIDLPNGLASIAGR